MLDALWQLGLPVIEALERGGHPAYLVGGAVRDARMGQLPHDLDIATSATPDQVLDACRPWRCIQTGIQHGTVTVLSPAGPVEVTTFRTEGAYSDHRRPDAVTFTTRLEEDLSRRDFTVNAMALGRDGLHDPFGGQADLAARVLRCVGDPNQRLQEDALRILRALRFSACLDFSIETDTAGALARHLSLVDHVARERLLAEFLRLVCGTAAARVLLDYSGVVAALIPELAPAIGFQQHTPYHHYDVYTHSIHAMAHTPPDVVLRLAALLHDVGKPASFVPDHLGVGHFPGHNERGAALADQALRRLRLDNARRKAVCDLITHHGALMRLEPKDTAAALSRLGDARFFQLLALDRADNSAKPPEMAPPLAHWDALEQAARRLLAEDCCLWLHQLAVDGRDLQSLGLRGPEIGQALHSLLDRVVSGELPNRREILLAQLSGTS